MSFYFNRPERRDNGRTCPNCGQSMSGAELVLPYEDGNNNYAYSRCPHCGYEQIEYGFGEDDD